MVDGEKDLEKSNDLWLELSDEERCNWMMFVRPAQNHLEQNLVAYQYGSDVFYTTIKNIQPKEELKVRTGTSETLMVFCRFHPCTHGISLCRCGTRRLMLSLSIGRFMMLQKKSEKVLVHVCRI